MEWPFVIWHFSDLHFGDYFGGLFRSSTHIRELLESVINSRGTGVRAPDLIIITGDVCLKGSQGSNNLIKLLETPYEEENTEGFPLFSLFKVFRDLLSRDAKKESDLTRQMLIVPGNHDIFRGLDEKIAEEYEDTKIGTYIRPGFKPLKGFIDKFVTGANYTFTDEVSYFEPRERISVYGINSCTLSSFPRVMYERIVKDKDGLLPFRFIRKVNERFIFEFDFGKECAPGHNPPLSEYLPDVGIICRNTLMELEKGKVPHARKVNGIYDPADLAKNFSHYHIFAFHHYPIRFYSHDEDLYKTLINSGEFFRAIGKYPNSVVLFGHRHGSGYGSVDWRERRSKDTTGLYPPNLIGGLPFNSKDRSDVGFNVLELNDPLGPKASQLYVVVGELSEGSDPFLERLTVLDPVELNITLTDQITDKVRLFLNTYQPCNLEKGFSDDILPDVNIFGPNRDYNLSAVKVIGALENFARPKPGIVNPQINIISKPVKDFSVFLTELEKYSVVQSGSLGEYAVALRELLNACGKRNKFNVINASKLRIEDILTAFEQLITRLDDGVLRKLKTFSTLYICEVDGPSDRISIKKAYVEISKELRTKWNKITKSKGLNLPAKRLLKHYLFLHNNPGSGTKAGDLNSGFLTYDTTLIYDTKKTVLGLTSLGSDVNGDYDYFIFKGYRVEKELRPLLFNMLGKSLITEMLDRQEKGTLIWPKK